MKPVPGLKSIARRYDAFLIDAWGVLHDGGDCFGNALHCLEALRDTAKPVVVISNAARRQQAMRQELERSGILASLYQRVVTSGELTWQALASGELAARNMRRGYYFGPERSRGLTQGLDIDWTEDATQAEFVLNTGAPIGNPARADELRPVLEPMARRGLPMICANPDRIAIRHGVMGISAGAIADLYARLGNAPVTRIGKPGREIFRYALSFLGTTDKSRILVIGDGFETDILGAKLAGLDSLFITGGIHRDEIGAAADKGLAKLGADFSVLPEYYCPALCW